jgi:hypothetical protein
MNVVVGHKMVDAEAARAHTLHLLRALCGGDSIACVPPALPGRTHPAAGLQQQQGNNPPGFQPQPLLCPPPLFAKQPQFDYAYK